MIRDSSSNHHEIYSLDLKPNIQQIQPDVNHFFISTLFFQRNSLQFGYWVFSQSKWPQLQQY